MAVAVDPRDVDAIREIVAAAAERAQAALRGTRRSILARPSWFRHGALPRAYDIERLAEDIDLLSEYFYAAPGDPDCVWHPFVSHDSESVERHLRFEWGPTDAIGRDLARAPSVGAAYRLAPFAGSRHGRATAGIDAVGPMLGAMREALRRLRRVWGGGMYTTGVCWGASPGASGGGPYEYRDGGGEWREVSSESEAWNLAAADSGEPGNTATGLRWSRGGPSVGWRVARRARWIDLRTEQERYDAAPPRYGWECTYQASFEIEAGSVCNDTPFAADVDIVVGNSYSDTDAVLGTGYAEGFNRAVVRAAPAADTEIPWIPLSPIRPEHPPFPELPAEPEYAPGEDPLFSPRNVVDHVIDGGAFVRDPYFDFGVDGGFRHFPPA